MKAVEVHVYYTNPIGDVFKLSLWKQQFPDGRERTRNHPGTFGETKIGNETSLHTLKRGLKEELPKLTTHRIKPHKLGNKKVCQESQSFPGLKTKYIIDVYEMHIQSHQFRPEGYVTREPSLTSYFVWKKIENV